MGAYYKTTDPTDTDFIVQSPTSLMQQGLQETSDQDDQQVKSLDMFGNAIVNVPHLAGQEDDVKAIQQGYQSKIDDLTNQINTDPANYRKRMGAIRNLQRDLSSNLQNGPLAYYSNIANESTAARTLDQQGLLGKDGKPGIYTPAQIQAASAYRLADYNKRVQANGGKAFDPETGVGVPFNTEPLYATPDIQKKVDDYVNNFKANSTEWSRPDIGKDWVFTGKHSTEGVEALRIADGLKNMLQSDPETAGWMEQGGRMGYLQGVTYPQGTKGNFTMRNPDGNDLSGQPIQPYSVDSSGNPVTNPNSFMGRIIQGAVDKSAYKKTVDDTEGLKENEYQVHSIDAATKYHYDQKLADNKNAYETSQETQKAANALKAKEDYAEFDYSLQNNIPLQQVHQRVLGSGSTYVTTSPNGDTVINPYGGSDIGPDGKPKPVNIDAVHTLLSGSQARIANLINQAKDADPTQRAMIMQDITAERTNYDQLQSNLTDADNYSSKTLLKTADNPKGKYSVNDLNGYTTYVQNQKPGLDKQKAQIQQQLDQITTSQDYSQSSLTGGGGASPNIEPYTDPTKAKQLLQQLQSINKTEDHFNTIGQDITNAKNDWYKQNTTTNTTLKGVGLTAENKQLIFDQLKLNPDAIIRNTSLDNSSGSLAEKAQRILKSVVENHENPSDYFDISTVNSPVKGVGTTVKVSLKDPHATDGNWMGNTYRWMDGSNPTGAANINTSDYGKTMLMTLPTSILHNLGSSMKANGATDLEKSTGDLITNDARSNTLADLNYGYVGTTPDGSKGPIRSTVYTDPTTKQNYEVVVVPQTIKNGDSKYDTYKTYIKDNKGKFQLLQIPATKDNPGIPTGESPSLDNIASALNP